MSNRDVWEASQGLDRVSRGERIQQYDVEQRRKRVAEVANRMNELEMARLAKMRAKKERGLLNRLKGFFVGTRVAGKPSGFALFRRDLFAPLKRGRR